MHTKKAPPPIWPASTVILVKEQQSSEILIYLIKRPRSSQFMPGAHVFPGGRVDPIDKKNGKAFGELGAFMEAGVREVYEEANIRIESPKRLRPFAWWITPETEKRRYDTRFFITLISGETKSQAHPSETDGGLWTTPSNALKLAYGDGIRLAPPTISSLQIIEKCATFAESCNRIEHPNTAIRPHFTVKNDTKLIALPGDELYPDVNAKALTPQTRFIKHDNGRYL